MQTYAVAAPSSNLPSEPSNPVTSLARERLIRSCIKMSYRQSEPKARLRRRAVQHDDPVRQSACQSHEPSFAGTQSEGCGKSEAITHPIWDNLHGRAHQYSLHPKNWLWEGWCLTHDLQKFEYDAGWLEPTSHGVE